MKRLTLYFLFLAPLCFAQKEAAQWRFGQYAGLSFQNGAPVAVTNTVIAALTGMGVSGISDSLGNLLFYVLGGQTIYNKNNVTMANGANIGGSQPGLQNGIVVRKSGSLYYVICHNAYNYLYSNPTAPMMTYAIVDMSLAAGLGSVTVSNQSITPFGIPMVSKMAVTKHCNGQDYWLLTHRGGPQPGSNQYYAYLVSSTGISTTPIISAIGTNQPQQGYVPVGIGYPGLHKFSPNGKKVASTSYYRTVELFDFDNSTGQLSNPIKLDTITNPTYVNGLLETNAVGVEFSPDGTKLYVSYINKHPQLCQFNLCAGSPAAIAASKTIINFDTLIAISDLYSLQTALDGKIYKCTDSIGRLSVINNPNNLGALCNYAPHAVPLGTFTTGSNIVYPVPSGGLPSFISNFFEQKPAIPPLSSSVSCGLAAFAAPNLCAAAGYSVSSYKWLFNDALSGAANTATTANSNHAFSNNGSYTVNLVLNYVPCGSDTLKKVIAISGLPSFSISGKNVICRGQSAVISVAGVNSFQLHTSTVVAQGSVAVQPSVTTVYTITGIDAVTGCKSLKTYTLTVAPCTGIDAAAAGNDSFVMYPNPSSGKVMIESETKNCSIKVFNQLGQLLYHTKSESGSESIDMSQWNNGVYFVEVQTANARRTQKLIKKE
jgi:hypothetical protein